MPEACAILLTGGDSRRLGVDKARLVVDGVTLADRAAAVLAAVADPVMEVGPGRSGLPAVREDPPGAGPLAAFVAGSRALAARGADGPVLLLAVDLPRVTTELLMFLRDWPGVPTTIPVVDGREQLVCARYGPDARVASERLLADGTSSLRAMLEVVDHQRIDESVWGAIAGADAFADVDSPDDAERLGIPLAADRLP